MFLLGDGRDTNRFEHPVGHLAITGSSHIVVMDCDEQAAFQLFSNLTNDLAEETVETSLECLFVPRDAKDAVGVICDEHGHELACGDESQNVSRGRPELIGGAIGIGAPNDSGDLVRDLAFQQPDITAELKLCGSFLTGELIDWSGARQEATSLVRLQPACSLCMAHELGDEDT